MSSVCLKYIRSLLLNLQTQSQGQGSDVRIIISYCDNGIDRIKMRLKLKGYYWKMDWPIMKRPRRPGF